MVPKNPELVKVEVPTLTVGESIERLIARLVLAGSLTLAGPLVAGCTNEIVPTASQSAAVLGGGQLDWAQQQGRRDTAEVSYMGSFWQQATDCGYRFGCQTIQVFVKLKVKPSVGANLDFKRVGIVYRDANTGLQTALGSYFTTFADGDEEWHVPFSVRAWDPGVFTFDAWYEDGVGNTYFDDNGGNLHALRLQNGQLVVAQLYSATQVTVGDDGVHGHIALNVADLGYDKDIRLVWTTDRWKTVHEWGIAPGANGWHWTSDSGDSWEVWGLDLDIPGPVDRFEYAIVYRHGVGGVHVYEFWDNNAGNNYAVERPPIGD
jgi:hypothetical protein